MTPEQFLSEMAGTANRHEFEAHMNLISKDVKVYGVPEFDVITYDDWYNQCKQEFADRLLLRVTYQGLYTLSETENEIRFAAVETIEATDGQENINLIEFVIQKEGDGQWRVVQERIMSEVKPEDDENSGIQ